MVGPCIGNKTGSVQMLKPFFFELMVELVESIEPVVEKVELVVEKVKPAVEPVKSIYNYFYF